MSKVYTGIAIFAVLVLTVSFQNCSKGLQSQMYSRPSQTAAPGKFRAGDEFDLTLLEPVSQMLAVQLEKKAYAISSKIRSVAIAANGLGFVKIIDAGSQANADKMALEGCFVLSGGTACGILARGNKFAVNENDLTRSFTFEIPAQTAISENSIPFVHPNSRIPVFNSYALAQIPKAMAVSVDGTYYIAASNAAFPIATDDEAKRLALERCEILSYMPPCTLIAVNNSTAPVVSTSIDFSVTAIGASIPAMRDADFTNSIVTYKTFMAQANARGAIYISANGAWGAAYSTNAATDVNATALTSCTAGAGGGVCVKYATNSTVVATPATLLSAINNQAIELHCQVVPRFDCAAHRNLGCPVPGIYYTSHTGQIQTESCSP